MQAVQLWIMDTNYRGDIAYFFECGHKHQTQANRIMELTFQNQSAREKYRYVSHAFVLKKESAIIQAADLFAWQYFTDLKHGEHRRPRRKDYAYLIDSGNHFVMLPHWERITEFVEDMKANRAWDLDPLKLGSGIPMTIPDPSNPYFLLRPHNPK